MNVTIEDVLRVFEVCLRRAADIKVNDLRLSMDNQEYLKAWHKVRSAKPNASEASFRLLWLTAFASKVLKLRELK